MRCPKCGSSDCQIFVTNSVKFHSNTKGFGGGKACCGFMALGPVGVLCGLCGAGKSRTWSEEEQNEYWICQNCGKKFTQTDVKYASVPVRFYLDNVNEFAEYENDSVVQRFIKNYSEDWRKSVLSDDMIVRQSSNKKFLKHKDSCEEKWFENAPVLFAVEDGTGVIVTGKDIIIDTVRIAFRDVSHVAIQEATIYIDTYCIRFSSGDKAEKFLDILKIILDSDETHYEEYASYEGLLAYLQDIQDKGNTSQAAHFSSQPEYEDFVKSLTEKGFEKVRQERPQHYGNYMQAEQDEKQFRVPALAAYIIQMVFIFLIRSMLVDFGNAFFNIVVWGAILGIVLFLYDTKIGTQFEEEKGRYLPPELLALIAENKLSARQKTGSIRIAELDKYEHLYGMERLQEINARESLRQKKIYLYGILIGAFICITAFHLVMIARSSDDETAEGKISNGRGDGEAVEKTVSAEEGYDDGEYAIDDMDGNTLYGLNEPAEFVENTVQEKQSVLLSNLYIDTVSASSELTDSVSTYKAEALFDGNKDTCWAEGVDGAGEGEYVEVRFTTPLYLTQIEFSNGYMKNEDVFKANGKIRKAELCFSDGSSCEANMENSDMVSFENPVLTDYLKITILEAESGMKYDDTCLTEIALWGYPDSRTEIPEDTELTVAGKNGQEFYIDDSILGTYSCYMGEDFGAEITLTYDEKNRQLYISGNCWEGMNVGMIEDEMISSFVSEENALLYDDGYGNQLYIYSLDTGEIYIKQNGSFGGMGTTFEGTYEK